MKRAEYFYIVLICIFTIFSLFGFVRLTHAFSNTQGIETLYSQGLSEKKILSYEERLKEYSGIVASSHGKKYYFEYCTGAKSIKPQNKIAFASEEMAQKAGYTKSTSCK